MFGTPGAMTLNLLMVPIDTLLKVEEQVLDEGISVLTLTQAVTDLGHNVIPDTKHIFPWLLC